MGYRYQEMDVATASPETLIVKLYDGAIRHARVAKEHHEAGRIGERGLAISKSLAIVSELMNALDFERGGEVATNLRALYEFVTNRLLEANMHGRGQAIDEAVSVLARVNEAWSEIARGAEVGS